MDTRFNTAAVALAASGHSARGPQTGKKASTSQPAAPSADSRRRFSITLSPKSAEAFEWLKEYTDADTDSEAIRNALRLHHVLLQRSIAGDTFFVSPAGNTEHMTKIDLFVAK